MAKVRGPLLSVDAAGQVGGALCFRHHAGGVHVLPVTAPGSRGWNLYLAAWMAQPGEEVNAALLIETATLLLLEDGSGVLLLEGAG